MPNLSRPLRVFLCHSSGDKPVVRELYRKLLAEGWIDPWLDEEKLYPGQDWDLEIENAVEAADAVIVCLSKGAATKEGYIQKELRFVLDIALTKPEENIFVIPIRLEDCQPPRRLRAYQFVDYFPSEQQERTYQRVKFSLEKRAESLGILVEDATGSQAVQSAGRNSESPKPQDVKYDGASLESGLPNVTNHAILETGIAYSSGKNISIGGIEFVCVPAGKFMMGSKDDNELAHDNERPQHSVDINYDYWMARFLSTNEQYAQYLGKEKHPVKDWQRKKDHPVVNVSWDDAMAYCKWFNQSFRNELGNLSVRLPTEAEWEKAARGTSASEWPWGNDFDQSKCNSREGGKGGTTPVGLYSSSGGDSPYGCSDMAGNVWEWTHSLFEKYPYDLGDGCEDEASRGARVLRGGSFYYDAARIRCPYRISPNLDTRYYNFGFRVCLSPLHFKN